MVVLGLIAELRQGCEKFAGDMAAMACYAALMPQSGITPLDNLRGIAFAACAIFWDKAASTPLHGSHTNTCAARTETVEDESHPGYWRRWPLLAQGDMGRSTGQMRWTDCRVIAFDTETTGFVPFEGDRVINLRGGAHVNSEMVVTRVKHHQFMINPEMPIPREASRVSGITDDMVSGAPTFSQLAKTIRTLMQDAILIAHFWL